MRSSTSTGAGTQLPDRKPTTPRSTNVYWERSLVERSQRWDATGQHGGTVWLTGLPAAGKSTAAAALEAELLSHHRLAYRLDGDNLRHGISGDLGFSAEDRTENVRRTAHVARLLADAGAIAIVALVSPFRADREFARALHVESSLAFIEVFIDTPLQECERRDPKGLYAKARAGELQGMTGVDDPYESPEQPEVTLHGGALDSGIDAICQALDELAPGQ